MYGRHRTFDVFAQGIRNLQDAFPNIEINCLVVGSGDQKAADKHGFEYHDYPNQPLSEKAQHRLSLCKNRADYYLFLGSDDILDEKLFSYYLERIQDGYDFIAPYDIHLHWRSEVYYAQGYAKGNARHGEPLAVGRCLSNKLLNDLNWELWMQRKEIGLDGLAWNKLKRVKNKHFFYSKDIGIVMDVKTKDNLSSFNKKGHVKVGRPKGILNKNLIPLLNGL